MKKGVIKLNIEGEICPYPLILALKKYQRIKNEIISGKSYMEIISDHPTACENIPLKFREMGLSVDIEKIGPSRWKITIKK